MAKTMKFFCENCGAEVKRNAKVCSKCGKFFSLVRCPVCLYTGEAQNFVRGCPSCGYAENKDAPVAAAATVAGKALPRKETDSLPFWAYALCACFVLSIVSAFVFFGLR